MNAVAFDTLKLSRKLEAGGFTHDQATTAAEALADAMSGAELATRNDLNGLTSDLNTLRSDLNVLRNELKSDMAALSKELKSDMAALSKELKSDMAALRKELKSDTAALRKELKADIELAKRDMTIRLGGMLIVAVGVMLAAMRFMLP